MRRFPQAINEIKTNISHDARFEMKRGTPPGSRNQESTAVRATLYPMHCSISQSSPCGTAYRSSIIDHRSGIGSHNQTIAPFELMYRSREAQFLRLSMAPVITMTYGISRGTIDVKRRPKFYITEALPRHSTLSIMFNLLSTNNRHNIN